jgi:hypothetical protein
LILVEVNYVTSMNLIMGGENIQMTQHIDTLRTYYALLHTTELVKLRHDAIRLGDKTSKELIDEEFKRRDISPANSKNNMKQYLGDSVYIEYIEHEVMDTIVLTTDNGNGPSNTIVLEDQVFVNLINFVNKIRQKHGSEPIIIPKEK